MSTIPKELMYAPQHQWVRIEGDLATIGITEHAQSELGDIVYAELPKIGLVVQRGDVIAVIESIKCIAEIYSPVTGVVINVNKDLEEFPKPLNESPYKEGWLAVIKIENTAELSYLISADEYRKLIGD